MGNYADKSAILQRRDVTSHGNYIARNTIFSSPHIIGSVHIYTVQNRERARSGYLVCIVRLNRISIYARCYLFHTRSQQLFDDNNNKVAYLPHPFGFVTTPTLFLMYVHV